MTIDDPAEITQETDILHHLDRMVVKAVGTAELVERFAGRFDAFERRQQRLEEAFARAAEDFGEVREYFRNERDRIAAADAELAQREADLASREADIQVREQEAGDRLAVWLQTQGARILPWLVALGGWVAYVVARFVTGASDLPPPPGTIP